MQIETERLILREMNEEDFDDLYCVACRFGYYAALSVYF